MCDMSITTLVKQQVFLKTGSAGLPLKGNKQMYLDTEKPLD